MVADKFTATWVSHSSINDFLTCPRAYYLKNVYRSPLTGHKIKLISPAMALGSVVHEVLESLSVLAVKDRFKRSLMTKLDDLWQKVSGKRGGFLSLKAEESYKNRAKTMLKKVMENPGPLLRLAVKIKMDLPYFWLSQVDNIILCGKIDWLEYLPESDTVHIIDFKTSKNEEPADSLQLLIYQLLVKNCQKRDTSKVSYWYLEQNKGLTTMPISNLDEAKEKILKIAKEIKLARQLDRFKCPNKSGCSYCRPLEAVIRGEAELVGVDGYKQDIYILNQPQVLNMQDSVIL